MSEDQVDEDFGDDEDEEGGGGKKKLIMIIAIVLLIIIAAVAGAFFAGVFDDAPEEEGEPVPQTAAEQEAADVAAALSGAITYYEIPDLTVNLNTGGKQKSYLKVKIKLELEDPQAMQALEEKLPRVMDNFQVYLRELRLKDLEGSAGINRLKEELLRRVNKAVRPVVVKDVLFQEVLVH